ncbi:hypothetical protein [Salisediminibacterium halotolerans]|nr:hypothetical protein [Salisediminibacterium halotolerans]
MNKEDADSLDKLLNNALQGYRDNAISPKAQALKKAMIFGFAEETKQMNKFVLKIRVPSEYFELLQAILGDWVHIYKDMLDNPQEAEKMKKIAQSDTLPLIQSFECGSIDKRERLASE